VADEPPPKKREKAAAKYRKGVELSLSLLYYLIPISKA